MSMCFVFVRILFSLNKLSYEVKQFVFIFSGNSERYKSKLKSKTKDLKDLLDIMNSEKGAGFENDFLKTSNEFLDTLNAIYKMHAVFVKQCRPKPNTSITDPLDIRKKNI